MREHLERSHRRFSQDFGEAPNDRADSRSGVASEAGIREPGRKNTNPSKTRKEPHKAVAH